MHSMGKRKVYIVAAKRTPIGGFGGRLSAFSATELGAKAIEAAVEESGVKGADIDEVMMGVVLQANLGQAPARQAAKFAGLPDYVPATTINKVCASGLKAVALAAQQIQLEDAEVVVAGGMESMSQVPYYIPTARFGSRYGHQSIVDGLQKDGLTDVYSDDAMGSCGELCAERYGIDRKAQDDYAVRSYTRALKAWESGKFSKEVVPVTVKTRKGEETVTEDEEFRQVNLEKIPQLRASFKEEGTITAANASTLSDGAAALVLVSEDKLREQNLKPLAEVVAFADAEQEPEWFTTTPSLATEKVLKKAGLKLDQIDFFEFNEAFSVVALANNKILGLDDSKVNVYGGAVALGHPLGCSGARILTTLVSVLHQERGIYGLAAICNGGGGATAMIIKKGE